jgi:hypothetical protein
MLLPEVAQDALCAQTDPELFFPEKGQDNKMAKSICAQCPISLACLEDALNILPDEDFGIWGGTSARERIALRKYPETLERLRVVLKEQDEENRKALNLTVIVRK